jgi:hypothetical protein
MLPLSDGLRARSFPFVNIALIAANFAVWIFYELPHLGSSVYHASFYPCTVGGTCHGLEPWGVSCARRCSCTGAGTTSSGTCCFWRSSARTSRTRSVSSQELTVERTAAIEQFGELGDGWVLLA